MRYVVAYDITDTNKRTRMANIIQEYGERIQKSVYEVILNDKTMDELIRKLNSYIVEPEDRLRLYPVCKACEEKIVVMGAEKSAERSKLEVYIV